MSLRIWNEDSIFGWKLIVVRKLLLCFVFCPVGAQQMEEESSETASNVAVLMTADEGI